MSTSTARRAGRRRRSRRDVWRDAARVRAATVSARLHPVARVLRPVRDYVSPLGFLVVLGAVVCFLFADIGHWGEFALIGYVFVAVSLLCVLLTAGRADLSVAISLNPSRVKVGERAEGEVVVANVTGRRVLPIVLELPVGDAAGRFNLPSLPSGRAVREPFYVPTLRRAVIPVGPATTVRGDPLGLLHRRVQWTQVEELFVHPLIIGLDPLDSGLLRDLEGRTTNELSVSDLAFHALRPYAPGDDRRHIHWRSSAKLGSSSRESPFLIRQFQDTRRSHLCVIVDADDLSYPDVEDFETAVSAAASVAVRAIRDEVRTTVVIGDLTVHEGTPRRTLDTFARATPARLPLASLSATAVRVAPATSIALIVTGAAADFADIRRAAANFSADVATVVLRIDPDRPPGMSALAEATLLSASELGDLPRLLGAGVTMR